MGCRLSAIAKGVIDAEVGDVIVGRDAGRTAASPIRIYGGVAIAWQARVAAWDLYQCLIAQKRWQGG
jgi:hypothetical protein